MGLVKDLHGNMKAHTGGDWASFVLAIDRNGGAKVNFQYFDS